ncbi:MAG: hypothetical protein V1755_03610 [Chloroflexota bacterium]
MLIDARSLPKHELRQADVGIAGAGAAEILRPKEFAGARFSLPPRLARVPYGRIAKGDTAEALAPVVQSGSRWNGDIAEIIGRTVYDG